MRLVYRGQRRQVGGGAMQFAVVGDDAIVVVVVGSGGGCGGGRHTTRNPNYKRWEWDWSSDVRMLFEDDPARPTHSTARLD